MSLHDTGEATCPRCGDILEGDFGPTTPEVGTEVRIPLECPGCEAPLEVVMSRAEDAIGVEVWVEDRRESDGG